MKNRLAVVALVLLAGAAGWWLRGAVDPPVAVARADTRPRPGTVRDSVRPAPQDDRGAVASTTPSDPWDALRHAGPKEGRLDRVLGKDAARAGRVLPELLARARREMDDHRIRTVLELMVAAGTPALRAIVLEAMVDDDDAFDFSHRDDRFREMFAGVDSEDVGEAALRRLEWEISRGETSAGSIGGYAVLVGASRNATGAELLRGLFEQGGSIRAVAVMGLAATGDGAVLADLARRDALSDTHVTTYLDRAGTQGWDTLEQLATSPDTGPQMAVAVAKVSARQRRPETGRLLERLWRVGAERAAMAGCMSLRPGTLTGGVEDTLRAIVFGAIVDESKPSNVRRGAFYAIEYSNVFQTERARALLADIIARDGKRYWQSAAQAALRNTERTLRRAEAKRGQ